MIERICQQCGKNFLAKSYEVKIGRGKYCSLNCLHQSQVGKPLSEVRRKKISASLMGNIPAFKGKHHSDEAKAKLAKAHIGKDFLTESGREAISKASKAKFISEETRKVLSQNTKAWRARIKLNPWQYARFIERQRKANKRNWQDPEFVKKMMFAFHKKPTKPERQLEAILNKHFPQYKYNGDGRLGIMLGGLTPDFPNVNGEKDLIEVFGDYYHSPEVLRNRWQGSELGKIMVYNSLGWKCLVIWEHELKELTEEKIVAKIKNFQVRKHACYIPTQ